MEESIKIKSIGELKKEARKKLKGRWGIAILVSFLAVLITSMFSISGKVTGVSNALSNGVSLLDPNFKQIAEETVTSTILVRIGFLINLLIGGSVSFGLCNFFMNIIREGNPQVENLFAGFKYFGKNFLIQLIVGIFSFLWCILIWLPAMLLLIIITVASLSVPEIPGAGPYYNGNISNANIVVMIILIIICLVITYIIISRYALAFYIYNDNEELSVMECINGSKEMMKGNKVKLFLLQLSFIGWHILSIITLFIGYLWLKPYIETSTASFYNNLKEVYYPSPKQEPTISLEKDNI